ncbi:MAG: hypothetical protein EHM28_09915 [Spirochaetaceae bacterium]|nr:MAG: hypothetical protein EHM28_09915 [Spirochaetaceae bacterium]
MNHFDESAVDKESLVNEREKFAYLAELNYKFSVFGRKSLLGEQTVRQIVYQPLIKTAFMKIFRCLVSPPHLTILTDREMILLRGELECIANYPGMPCKFRKIFSSIRPV